MVLISCLFRFATKCALASSQGVSLDATLDDLTDLESKIDEMLAQGEKSGNKVSFKVCVKISIYINSLGFDKNEDPKKRIDRPTQ